MVVTQWSSIGPVVLFPKQFGLHDVTDDELMAIVHYWRAIGFTLGIQDRFNCCCDTLEETKYICKLILDHDFMPPIKEGGEHCQLAIKMSSGLAKALNCFAPMLCFQGLLRYIYKTVLQVPVYVEVKNRKGYRNLVYMIQEMMQKSYWQWIFSYAIRFGLFCVSFRQKVIAEHFRKKYDHIDYMKEAKYCPYKQTVQ
ncbi:hypothetical protein HDE_03540 [Halotydeus destructor]|nr:hypothetical protein HDE_03540 [Halotydeus destructor]